MERNIYVELLRGMIRIPSYSKDESGVADYLEGFLDSNGVSVVRYGNNLVCKGEYFKGGRKTMLLNSHIDTVKPNGGYTRDPFLPDIEDGKLYGLGSNDAGASVVGLIATFLKLHQVDLGYNLVLVISCEEEISGFGGIESVLPLLGKIDVAIVGEPTCMQMAIGERGLMVLDCVAHGKAGHAARDEGQNAIYKAIKDIEWFRSYGFERVSALFGEVKMSVTVVQAGGAHNVVPDACHFTVDVRVPECYSLEEVLAVIKDNVDCDVKERSLRMRPSRISVNHALVRRGLEMGLATYGSPTTSDAALMRGVEVLKMGVGDSARSHTANEFVYLDEIARGIDTYTQLLQGLKL